MYVKSAIGIAALLALTVTGTVAASSAPGTTGGSEGRAPLAAHWPTTARIRARRSGARREGARPGRAVGRRQLGHHPRRHRPGQSGPRPGDDRQGARVLERPVVRHRVGRRAHHGLRRRRRRHGQRVALGEPHGGDPPGAHLPGDRQDRVDRRQLQPGPGGSRQRHPVPGPERRRLHRRLPRRRGSPSPAPCPRPRPPGPVPVVLGGLRRTARSGGRARPRRGLHVGDRRGPVRARRELRRRAQHGRRHRRGRDARRHAGQRPQPRLAAVRRRRAGRRRRPRQPAGRRELDHRRHLLGEHDGARRGPGCSRPTPTSRAGPTSTPTGSTPPSRRTTSSASR